MLNKKTWSMALAFLCLVLFTATGVLAQGGKRHQEKMDQLKTELGLTEAQSAALETLHKQHREQMHSLHAQGQESDREQMRQAREQHRAELAKILSPEQMQRMEELHQAHRGPGGGQHGGIDKEKRQEIHRILLAQRAKLEPMLSEADKAEIAQLRTQLQALRPQLKAQKREMKDGRAEGQKPSPEMRAAMEPLREEKRAIMEEAGAIASRYQSQIQSLHEEVKPQLDALHGPEGERPGCDGPCPKAREDGKGKRAEGHQGHKQHMAAKFILMDPSKSPGQSLLSELPEMEIFPNPSENANTVTFFLEASDDVRLELLSKEGQVLRTIFQGKMEAGAHSLPVETSGLGTNLYYYKITTSEGSSTKRFTVAR